MAQPESLSGGRLTIDLEALAANWAFLDRKLAGNAECAATIKANAYGTGSGEAAQALWQAGCRTFFVALPSEALSVRKLLPDATLYVLNGLFPQTAQTYADNKLRPVLGCEEELREWATFCAGQNTALPAAIHVDTGMNRLGLRPETFTRLMSDADLSGAFKPCLLMSHLACASEPENPANRRQLELFSSVTASYAHIPRSLANSGGVFLGPEYHFDLVRPGIALYGGRALDDGANPMAPVVMIEARVLGLRTVPAGETIGYGGTQTADREMRIAIVSAGYADGLLRQASSSDANPGGFAFYNGHRLPLVGRISMDMMALDATNLPENALVRGSLVEMLGPNVAADTLAAYAQTIDYEYLTALGRRYHRQFAALPAPAQS